MGLALYRRTRDSGRNPEPGVSESRTGVRGRKSHPAPLFVIQEHHATRLHFDFRLEEDGVLKSWALTKGPMMERGVRRLAIEVEDHPLEYEKFHGFIPKGEYGGGKVLIRDHGTFENIMATKSQPLTVSESIEAGHVEIHLKGKRLKGAFALIRLEKAAGSEPSWLFLKMKKKPEISLLERAQCFAAKKGSSETAPSRSPSRSKVAARKKTAAAQKRSA